MQVFEFKVNVNEAPVLRTEPDAFVIVNFWGITEVLGTSIRPEVRETNEASENIIINTKDDIIQITKNNKKIQIIF